MRVERDNMLRIGILSAANLHTTSYIQCLRGRDDVGIVAIWDHDEARGREFAERYAMPFVATVDELLSQVDAVMVASENVRHAELIIAAARAGKHVLCEKPLVTSEEQALAVEQAATEGGIQVMTAFPCRFSPAYVRLKERVRAGEIGTVQGLTTTNRGRCPFLWYVDPSESGGGAMIDHTVHVADLLRDLVGEVTRVQAQTGHNMYGQAWDDTAMLTLEFENGAFASLDSSWSRPQTYKTWGDVTMNVVGERGVIELDMFGQDLQHYRAGNVTHTVASYGSNFDLLMINAFVGAIQHGTPVPIPLRDGLQAARIALAGYRSISEGQPVAVRQ